MSVTDLSSYRERRTVRRVAAVGLVVGVVYGSVVRVQETWQGVEQAIRWAARLLGDDEGGEA